MDWKSLLEALAARGWTQPKLSSEFGVSQSTISDLKRGVTKDPSFTLGSALQTLHKSGRAPGETQQPHEATPIPVVVMPHVVAASCDLPQPRPAVEGTLCLNTALPMVAKPGGILRCEMCGEFEATECAERLAEEVRDAA